MSHKRTHTSHMNLLVIFLSALFCLTALGAAGYIVSTHTQSVQAAPEPVSLAAEGNVKTGTLNQDPEKRQQELNQVVEEGMLAFSVNATPFMKNGASTANLLIENPPGNGKRFTITIRRNDTGEVIYQSGYLDPEQYIDDVPLDVVLPKGEYACTAYFDAYRIDDNAYIGSAGAEIKLYVLE
ncbi:MAG: hypothetical protein ACLTC4_23865 [Hungatella hathewayi]|nr:hypothetical protein [Hungatella hathewayi]MBS4986576.1 hypothetical protein [Hungatella hathewayi]